MDSTLTVKLFSGLTALEQLAADINALNLSSARPSLYLSADFLRCLARNTEVCPSSDDVRLYTVWENDRLIGCLPLRLAVDRFGPLRGSRLCFLAPVAMEQLGILAAPGDEERVAHALVRHLRDREAHVGMLELVGQTAESALSRAMHQAANDRFRVRDFDESPYSEIAVAWPDIKSYFDSLSSSWRRNVARCARLLLAADKPELVFAEGAQATTAWFEAYLDLESRSWKHLSSAAITHHAHRVAYHRNLVGGQGGYTPSFIGILIDGFLVAGTLNGSNTDAPVHARGVWGFEMAYDASYADLGPGILLDLLLVHTAIQREEKFVNLLNGFADYKRRWKAEVMAVKKVQLIRRWSLHNLRGTAGDLMRQLRARMRRKSGTGGTTQEPKATDNSPRTPPIRPDRTLARAITAQALAYAGPGIERLDRTQIAALLPFDMQPTR